MIINKIIITDFGVYGGKNEFNFSPTNEKSVILCGGSNGAGKTTLFESIMICLYGKDFDETISEKKYNQKILRSFHKNVLDKNTSKTASIEIEFEIYESGEIKKYHVLRAWENIEGKISEELSIKKAVSENNKFEELQLGINYQDTSSQKSKQIEKIDAVDKSDWQLFINQLIPRGIAKLFFFDGEQIQSLANEGNENKYIQSSFDTLLGLDIVGELQKDLTIVMSRSSDKKSEEDKRIEGIQKIRDKKYQDAANKSKNELDTKIRFYTYELGKNEFFNEDLEEMLEIKKELEENITIIEKNIKENDVEIGKLERELKNEQEIFRKIGGEHYDKQEKVNVEINRIQEKITLTKKGILDLAATELPFSLIPAQMEEIKKQVISDQERIKAKYYAEVVSNVSEKISKKIHSTDFLETLPENVKNEIESVILETITQDSKTSNSEMNFDFSEAKITSVLEMIERSKLSNIEKINQITDAYKIQNNELERLKASKLITLDNNEIEEVISRIEKIISKKSEIEKDREILDSDMHSKRDTKLKLLDSKIRQCLDIRKTLNKTNSSSNIIHDVIDTLDNFAKIIREKKISILEDNILKGLQLLLHKEDFVHKVSVNRDTFEVKLYDKNNDEITKDMLSKGELQIYATSLVWALAKTSSRPLPFMIDTPLARLDTEHRENLVESFYPNTSHQTIILSTNSEIDAVFYEKLKPSIARAYLIGYDSMQGKTSINQGYFFGVDKD